MDKVSTAIVSQDAQDFVQHHWTQFERLAERGKNLEVVDAGTAEDATAIMAVCRKMHKAIDGKRLEVKRQLMVPVGEADTYFNGYLGQIKDVDTTLGPRLKSYLDEQQRLARAAEEARLHKEREELEAQRDAALEAISDEGSVDKELALKDAALAQEALDKVPEKVEVRVHSTSIAGKAGTSTVWKARIVDINKIPESILNIPKVTDAIQSALNQMARTMKSAFDVPGAESYEESVLGIR